MNLRTAHPNAKPAQLYKTGFQAGYDLGFRIGKEDRQRSFDGTSIILTGCTSSEDFIAAIQNIEALTPPPYEMLVADNELSEKTKQYIQKRTGAIRHIIDKSDKGAGSVLNKAAYASHGREIAVLIGSSPKKDGWIGQLLTILKEDSLAKMICVYSGLIDPSLESGSLKSGALGMKGQVNIHGLLFRRELLFEIGGWDDKLPSLKESVRQWIQKVPNENRRMVSSSEMFE
ncbi:glycosyltransferase family 2 protein [Paenibacillus dakarensis]|uniref:glycosyltransferase family 2 protein n=1 Tax=Paenibacillus dakarensis TaxID=1527293 RepID=UPI0006D58D06|nr:glycosyltransferase family 2 protein [Paenibacillus dakarensis]